MERGQVHFIGAGGVGVAGVANIAADLGYAVTGSDAVDSPMLEGLRARGLDVSPRHLAALPGSPKAVVYSSAIPESNAELADARRRGIPCYRRGEYLGQLAREFETVIAVSGSHGKTSTTAMIAHILKSAGLNPGYLIGGQVNGWERSATAGNGRTLVTEVDESDGTQVFTHASIAIVLNIEDDHCWGFGGVEKLEKCFVEFAQNAQHVIAWRTDATKRLLGGMENADFLTDADIPKGLALPFPGAHWRQNASLAVAAAVRLGVDAETAVASLADFPGVNRRFTVRGTTADGRGTVIDDYAHHPTELRATLSALSEGYPGQPLLVVFQPHRFERVKRYGAQFSELLGQAARAWVVAPFAAWVADGAGVEPSEIAKAVPGGRGVYMANDPKAIAAALLDYANGLSGRYVVAVIGAGDVLPITERLLKN